MERITIGEVRHVARLARIDLTDDELAALKDELSDLLGHVDRIRRLETHDVPPTAHPLPLTNVFRPDEVTESLERDEVLQAAPASEEGRFLVPRVLGEAP